MTKTTLEIIKKAITEAETALEERKEKYNLQEVVKLKRLLRILREYESELQDEPPPR